MRAIVYILLVAAAGFIGYQQWLAHTAAEQARLAEQAEQAQLAQLEAAPAGPKKMKVTCLVCKGEGRLPDTNSSFKNRTKACQVCNFVGSREFELPVGASVCPDCKGMGRVRAPAGQGKLGDATRCNRCSAKGFIRPR